MADEKEVEKTPQDILKLQKAVSGRSTCRATGDKIEKGEWRVGIDAWSSGRMSTVWQKAAPFLENCVLEECTKGQSGSCKLTGHKFAKGETRFALSNGKQKIFLTINAAAKVVRPVMEAEGVNFSPSGIKGLEDVPEAAQEEYKKEFGIQGTKGQSKAKRKSLPATANDEAAPELQGNKRAKKKRLGRKSGAKEGGDGAEGDDEVSGSAAGDMEKVAEEQQGAGGEGSANDEHEDGEILGELNLSSYELEREQIIARNKERIKALGIKEAAMEIMPTQRPKPRTQGKGLSAKKKTGERAVQQRSSLRVRGIQADQRMIDQELRNGRVVLSKNDSPWQVTSDDQQAGPQQPKDRHPKESLPFESDNGGKQTDAQFLELLQKAAASTFSRSKGEKGRTQVQKLQLKEQDVAKVTKNGITHVQWHPQSDRLIIAAADKSGNLGLWDIDHQPQASEEGDGVLSFQPHYSYVSGLRWAGGDGAAAKLFSASYDGSLRCLDPECGKFELVVTTEDTEFSAFDCTADGNVAILGDNDGYLHVYDVRENQGARRGTDCELHSKRINTLHIAPGDDHLFVSSSSDNSLAVWDLRKLESNGSKPKSLASAVHSKTCQSAYFCPDGSKRVLSVSRDDTLTVWEYNGKSNLKRSTLIPHNNNTGRWVVPFRATWSPSGDAIICGSMKREIGIFDPHNGERMGTLQSEHMTAIASRAVVHPDLNILAACTSSGRVHVYRT